MYMMVNTVLKMRPRTAEQEIDALKKNAVKSAKLEKNPLHRQPIFSGSWTGGYGFSYRNFQHEIHINNFR